MKTRDANKYSLFALTAGLGLMMASRVAASSGTFQAFGYVLTPSGEPVVNIDVIGDDYVGDLYTFKTDDTGRYSVDFDSDGNYKVYVSCPQLNARGYGCVNPVAISIADGAINVDFTVLPAPLQVSNTSLPRANVGANYSAQLAATGGQAPYTWQLDAGSPSLPLGLSLNSSGHIFGMPTAHSSSNIKVQVTDAKSVVTNKVLLLTVNPQPVLSPLLWATNRFSMLLIGGSNQNYTLQTSTGLSSTNWTSLFVTSNRFSNSFTITDTNATNHGRMYRVMVGP